MDRSSKKDKYYLRHRRHKINFNKVNLFDNFYFLKDNIFSYLDNTSIRNLCSVNKGLQQHFLTCVNKIYLVNQQVDYINLIKKCKNIHTLTFCYDNCNYISNSKLMIKHLKFIINENIPITNIIISGNNFGSGNVKTTQIPRHTSLLINTLQLINSLKTLNIKNSAYNINEKQEFKLKFTNIVI